MRRVREKERERNRRHRAEYLNEDKNIGWKDRKRVEVKKEGGSKERWWKVEEGEKKGSERL